MKKCSCGFCLLFVLTEKALLFIKVQGCSPKQEAAVSYVDKWSVQTSQFLDLAVSKIIFFSK